MEARYMTDLEWRICHAVNIYVFKNGNDMQTPILVHIPPARKKTMQSVMDTVQERVTYPVGYAKTLYTMDGTRIRHPCELEMYNNYVVASNFEKAFKCVEYGRKRSPLLVLNRYSKHIRVLRLQNENYDQWLRKKREMGSERPQYVYPERYIHEGIMPQDLPVDRMGNTYVPNCDVDPNEPNYAEKHGMRKVQLKPKQKNTSYAVNAFTVEQDPIEEYLQHIEPNEIEEEEEDAKKFKKLGQDQVFYQPQQKWRTKGVLEKKKDEHIPLFPTASDIFNANFSTENEDDIEDIAELQEDFEGLADVQEDIEGIADVQEDIEGIPDVQEDIECIADVQEDIEGIADVQDDIEGTVDIQEDVESIKSIAHVQEYIEGIAYRKEDNGNVVIEESNEDSSDSNTVTVTVSMHEKKSAQNKREKIISFSQKKGAKKSGNSYNIIRSGRRCPMNEKCTQTDSDQVL